MRWTAYGIHLGCELHALQNVRFVAFLVYSFPHFHRSKVKEMLASRIEATRDVRPMLCLRLRSLGKTTQSELHKDSFP
jgi:hypothetical protein